MPKKADDTTLLADFTSGQSIHAIAHFRKVPQERVEQVIRDHVFLFSAPKTQSGLGEALNKH